jgi:hypothetical protein
MRHTQLAITIAALLAIGLATAPAAVGAEPADADVDAVFELYNRNVGEAPDVVRDRFADERVALTIERTGEEDLVYTAVTDASARIESVEAGEHEPTLRVTTDEATVRDVAEADDTAAAAVEAYESGAVEVEGVGPTNTVKVEATKIGLDIASRLGLL